MRSSKSRSRNKSNRNRSMGNIVNRVFDSSGPEGKVRGTPQQIIDKYTQLARDAQLGNDRVATENFQQHAEHYTRMLAEAMREQEARREQHDQNQGGQNNGGGQQNNNQNNQNNNNQNNQQGGNQQRNRQRDQNRDNDGGDDAGQSSGSSDVIDTPRGDDSGLVETPESMGDEGRPQENPRPRRQRRPRAEAPSEDGKPDAPQEAAE